MSGFGSILGSKGKGEGSFQNQARSIPTGLRLPAQWGYQRALDHSGKKLWVISIMTIVSNPDRAMTVREWDPVLQPNGRNQ